MVPRLVTSENATQEGRSDLVESLGRTIHPERGLRFHQRRFAGACGTVALDMPTVQLPIIHSRIYLVCLILGDSGSAQMTQDPPLEVFFNAFVRTIGGEHVGALINSKNPPSNADYFFKSQNVIVELKALEKETFSEKHRQKTAGLFADWHRRGLVIVRGTARVDLAGLPKVCQEEWLNLLGRPVQKNVLSTANAQIRQTKHFLNVPDAKGVLLVASDGNFDLTPHAIHHLLSRLLMKKHPDGRQQYSQIDGFAYFSGRTLVQVGEDGRPTMIWISSPRQKDDKAITEFLSQLGRAWHQHVERISARPMERLDVDPDRIRDIRFAGVAPPLPRINVADRFKPKWPKE